MACTGILLSAQTLGSLNQPGNLFYMAEDIGGGIFFERKVTLADFDARYVNTSGDTMAGVLNMDGFTIDNIGAPTLGGQAANKAYVDALVGAVAPPFTDTIPLVKGSVDTTKLFRFEVDGFTAGTTRVLTPQNADYTIAGTNYPNEFLVQQTFNSQVNFGATATTIDAAGSYVGPLMEIENQLTVDTGAGGEATTRFRVINVDTSDEVFKILGSGEVLFFDNVRQTFNPGATVAGFNFGSVVADPSTPINGDSWYRSDTNELRFRIAGATVSFSGSSVPPFTDTNALIKGSVDPTKLFRFEVDGFTAGVTRVLTPQDADYTIAGLETANIFTANQNINGLISLNVDGSATLAGGAAVIFSDGQVDIGSAAIQLFATGAANFASTAVNIDAFGTYVGPTVHVENQLRVETHAGEEATTRFLVFNTDTLDEIFKILGSGDVLMTTAARLSFASGTNQRAGNAVLVAGTVTVANTTVTANTIVMLTRKTAGGTVGTLITYTVTAATSFTINSDSALDTSTFSYMLIEVP